MWWWKTGLRENIVKSQTNFMFINRKGNVPALFIIIRQTNLVKFKYFDLNEMDKWSEYDIINFKQWDIIAHRTQAWKFPCHYCFQKTAPMTHHITLFFFNFISHPYHFRDRINRGFFLTKNETYLYMNMTKPTNITNFLSE